MTREEQLEALLRIALRKLGGRFWYSIAEGDLRPRSNEGAIEIETKLYGGDVTLPGVLSIRSAREVLDAINRGADSIVRRGDPHDVWYGTVRYETAAGHAVELCVRSALWHYVISVSHADGRRWEYDDGWCANNGDPFDDFESDDAVWRLGERRERGC